MLNKVSAYTVPLKMSMT